MQPLDTRLFPDYFLIVFDIVRCKMSKHISLAVNISEIVVCVPGLDRIDYFWQTSIKTHTDTVLFA